ncbi:MAG: hypothetical protein IIX41_05845 [Bacteroidales bacterium]|nr:hypothetical protein [Bacteroidales bacterium]
MAEVGDGSSAEDDGGDDAVLVLVVQMPMLLLLMPVLGMLPMSKLLMLPGLMFELGSGSALAVFLQNVGHANLFSTVFWQG